MADDPETPQGEDEGPRLGDFIASVTKKMGIPPCKSCKDRQEWLNSLSKRAWKSVRRR